MTASRVALEQAHDRIISQMRAAGLEPVLTADVRDVLTDNELKFLVKGEGLRLVKYRWLDPSQ